MRPNLGSKLWVSEQVWEPGCTGCSANITESENCICSPRNKAVTGMCAYVPRHFSQVQLFATLWTVAHQAPLSSGFSRQECCSGLPFPSPGDLPKSGIEHSSPALQADSTHWVTGEAGHGRQQIIPLPVCYKPVSLCYLGHGQWVRKFGGLSPERCFTQGICLSLVSSASLSKIFGKFLVPFLGIWQ